MAQNMTLEKMQMILTTIPFQLLERNKGIYEFYEEDGISIGISFEDLEKYDGIKYEGVYVFNLFHGDEYINIDGEYYKTNNTFVSAGNEKYDLISMLVNSWNMLVQSRR